jgi:GrpB-like predicted nucleotidyltransferase (UPF0157 family)
MNAKRMKTVPYRDDWPREFLQLGNQLRDTLGPVALRIDHIGSTSVPGLDAKDIIDIQVTAADLDPAPLVEKLAPRGFILREDYNRDHVPFGRAQDIEEWSKLNFQRPPDMRPMHFHVRQAGRANQRYPLLFRDYLRNNPGAAANYALIKRELIRLNAGDVDAYYAIKDPVCDLIMDAAELWAEATRWEQGPSDA